MAREVAVNWGGGHEMGGAHSVCILKAEATGPADKPDMKHEKKRSKKMVSGY